MLSGSIAGAPVTSATEQAHGIFPMQHQSVTLKKPNLLFKSYLNYHFRHFLLSLFN